MLKNGGDDDDLCWVLPLPIPRAVILKHTSDKPRTAENVLLESSASAPASPARV